MNRIRPSAVIFARFLIVAIFLANGFGVVDQSFPIHEMAARGVPVPLAMVLTGIGRAIEIVAGLGVALGEYRRISAAALILFLISATLIAHPFWIAPRPLVQVQLVNFLKNLSMMGGLLFAAAASTDPVCLSECSFGRGDDTLRIGHRIG